jgi:hypothetical protein
MPIYAVRQVGAVWQMVCTFLNIMNTRFFTTLAIAACGSLFITSSAAALDRDPHYIQRRYGVHTATTAYVNGRRSTIIPVTLSDGRTGQLVIPQVHRRTDPHALYYRDAFGDFHPVRMNTYVTRQQLIREPRVIRYQSEPRHRHRQQWEKDALIVGGGAGAGALIGAVAGGGKGAAVGATAGGVGGLIYDLATRK